MYLFICFILCIHYGAIHIEQIHININIINQDTFQLNIIAEHRLTEQEANDEIRTLLHNFVSQLQSVKDRVPSRGSAMTTISILLDTTKPLSNSQQSLMPPTIAIANKKSVPVLNHSVGVIIFCFHFN